MKIGMKKGRPPIKVKRPLAYTLLNFIYKASLPLLCHILLVSQCYLSIGNRVGHESVEITYRYAHLFPTVQKEMADKLNVERSN